MPHKYEWKSEWVPERKPRGQGPSIHEYHLDLPAAPGSVGNPSYPVQGTFRLEYRQEYLDANTRLWVCSAKLSNIKDGWVACIWHDDHIVETPGEELEDTVMKKYLEWARREQEKASALFMAVQRAWDHLHPDDSQDRT